MPQELETLLREVVRSEVGDRLESLHRFVDRRFAELSAELHATVELAEFSEGNLTAQIAAIHGQISGLVSAPTMATRNSGSELEAVVVATEQAANSIMEAAEAIADWASGGGQRDPAALLAKVNDIFEACTFQDLTGQRLRRAIEHLQSVEAMLDQMVTPQAVAAEAAKPVITSTGGSGPDIDQAEIDRLMAF
jgi:chemotaxis protein CheZ